ncbi:MAG: carbohydrate kinase [Propionibacteriaceae bacterium]|jgi:mannose-6-phosphate isomerase|nr:carbohydrate kinase [Propionibacteriaceae bacterium]
MDITLLPSNRPPERFYRGGRKITDFRGEPPAGPREPEDWVGSTTALAGETCLGITVLPDGQTLADAVADQPEAWLGRAHLDRYGPDARLLVKLLDAGQRLPVHAHPHGDFAGKHLGRSHGKAEAWYILDGGEVHLGLTHDVTLDQLQSLVNNQDVDSLLSLLHRVEVQPGDIIYVPPGVLHAIGEGVFLVELQEPEDLSILLEWRDFELDGEQDGHLGLGFDLALHAIECRGRSAEEIRELVRPAGVGPSVFPAAADPYFVLERVVLDGESCLEPGFAVLVTLTGQAALDGTEQQLTAGTTAVVPHAFGKLQLRGRAEILICRPPDVDR